MEVRPFSPLLMSSDQIEFQPHFAKVSKALRVMLYQMKTDCNEKEVINILEFVNIRRHVHVVILARRACVMDIVSQVSGACKI